MIYLQYIYLIIILTELFLEYNSKKFVKNNKRIDNKKNLNYDYTSENKRKNYCVNGKKIFANSMEF